MAAGLEMALNAISLRDDEPLSPPATVLVLGRFTFTFSDFDKTAYRQRLQRLYPGLHVRFMTAHGSKGKEADYVVILDVSQGRYGFPSEKVTEPALEFLLPEAEPFRFAEERRLFYVALTRARHRTYVVYDPMKPSRFVTELLNKQDPYPVCVDEHGCGVPDDPAPRECPRCEAGRLVVRAGEYGKFVGCSHYPYCDYQESVCPTCGGVMARQNRERICGECGARTRLCPRCGGDLVPRQGPYGDFIGCSNYGRGAFSCTYKEKV
jgi:DNA helicase-4